MDCHYLGVGAPANVRPKLLWDDEHIQVIFFQLDAPTLRTLHVGTVADLGSVGRRAVHTIQAHTISFCPRNGHISPSRQLRLIPSRRKLERILVSNWRKSITIVVGVLLQLRHCFILHES
jgi:hypothetical protein